MSILTLYADNPIQSGSSAGRLTPTQPGASTSTTGWIVGTTGAVSFVSHGALATITSTSTLTLVAPTTVAADDILVAHLIEDSNSNITLAPGWTSILTHTIGASHFQGLAWKRAVSGDAGSGFSFLCVTTNVVKGGLISVWRGCTTSGNPISASSVTGLSTATIVIRYPDFTPAAANTHVVYSGSHQNLTDWNTIPTPPTNTIKVDSETAAGSDFCLIVCSGDGGQTTALGTKRQTQATTGQTSDAIGAVFGLIPNGSGPYALAFYNTERAASTFAATAEPSGAPASAASDCWRLSDATTGDFSAGTWYSSLSVIGVTSGGDQDGRARFRLWRSANADGTSATEITQGAMVGSGVTDLSTTVAQSSSASTQVGAFSLSNEYLFLQAAWEIAAAGGAADRDVLIRLGSLDATTGSGLVTSAFSSTGGAAAAVVGGMMMPYYLALVQDAF